MAHRKFSDLLQRFPEAEPSGDGYVVRCPAHNDGHPSLLLTLKADGRLLIHCRASCSTDGVLKALGMERHELFDWVPGADTVTTAATFTPTALGVAELTPLRAYVLSCAERLRGPDGAKGRDYLADRFGIDPDLAYELKLGVDPGGDAETLEWRSHTYARSPRLVVPFTDPNDVVRGVQGRDLSGHDGVRWAGLSNPGTARWSRVAVFDKAGDGYEQIIITEGPGDALTAVGLGYRAMAIRGAGVTSNAITDDVVAWLKKGKVYIAGDNDTAGTTFNSNLLQELGRHGIPTFKVSIPHGIKDITEWREKRPHNFASEFATAVRGTEHASIPFDDLGNARRLLYRLGGGVRFVPEIGFYLWRNGRWQHDKLGETREQAHGVADEIRKLPYRDDKEKAAIYRWAQHTGSSRGIDSMLKELSVMHGVATDIDTLDAHANLLCFLNGIVDLKTGELFPHDPSLLITKQVDLHYHPDAPCPRWEQFLRDVHPGQPEMPDYLRRLIGYGITGDTSEQCFAVLWGNGANGKSVFTDTLTQVFREITEVTAFATFEEKSGGGVPNDVAALKGARLVMASEGERGKPMAESVIKRVTGNDLITARFMRKEFFSFRPTFLILLATNHRPTFRGQDEGLWRRVKLIPFSRYFAPDERDHYIGERLLEEATGIAAWAVRGAVEWYRDGLNDPEPVTTATKGYRETSNGLDGFFPGVLVREPDSVIEGAEVYKAYTAWSEREGLSSKEIWSRKNLYAALEEQGVHRKRAAAGMMLLDVRLTTPSPEPSGRLASVGI